MCITSFLSFRVHLRRPQILLSSLSVDATRWHRPEPPARHSHPLPGLVHHRDARGLHQTLLPSYAFLKHGDATGPFPTTERFTCLLHLRIWKRCPSHTNDEPRNSVFVLLARCDRFCALISILYSVSHPSWSACFALQLWWLATIVVCFSPSW
ncbi:hypothetical protein G6O67_004411 [Ophiocordyceps sinensis]|uniref:Uncharacterized protein n=1 Tax=Ophiocordyceps sinensis TaxID=72228 RepID=A0A8H4PP31_9HYPO|nr:hypothetical protein G6O67_004411 [Ophiocordyceps sinensis]